jgi:hypothetical protein
MPQIDRRAMKGIAECPDCQRQLVAALGMAGRWARCGCGCRFMLPAADAMFANAAVYLMVHEPASHDRERLDTMKVAV